MNSASRQALLQLVLLAAVAVCLFFVALGRLPLLEPDEGRNAEVAREMLATHDWITPHFDALPYLDKPALYFWMVAASFRLFGLSEAAARLPSALAALATMLLTWWLARRLIGSGAGWRAALIFATSPLTLALARTVIFDMTLTLLVTLAMAGFWLAEQGHFGRPGCDRVMFAAMGLAAITKGPVGFLLPLLSAVAYLAVRGRLGDLGRLRWGAGVAIFLACALPWFLAVSIRNPDFPRYAFWQESLLRFATGHAHREGGLFYYIPVYLGGFLPWSFFLLFGLWNHRAAWKQVRTPCRQPEAFLLCWAGAIFVFFTISRSKLPAYILPALVPLSILTARLWDSAPNAFRDLSRHPDWLTAGFATLILLGLSTAAAPVLLKLASVERLEAKKIHPAVLPLVVPALVYTGVALAAMGVLGRNLVTRSRARHGVLLAFILTALTVPLLLVRWIRPLAAYAATASSRRLAASLLEGREGSWPVYGYYYFRTSLPFYLRRPVGLVTADGGETTSNYVVSRFSELRRATVGNWPLLLDAQRFQALTQRSSEPVLVMARNELVPALAKSAGHLRPLWDAWQYSVWVILPPPAEPETPVAGQSPAGFRLGAGMDPAASRAGSAIP